MNELFIMGCIGIILGGISLLLDLSNRLFGSYSRNMCRSLWRIFAVVFLVSLPLVPFYLYYIDPTSRTNQILFFMSGLSGCVFAFHYIFPYDFGIKKVNDIPTTGRNEILTRGVYLHKETVKLNCDLSQDIGLLVISDLHCNSIKELEMIKNCFNKIKDKAFDIICILGDFGENNKLLDQVIGSFKALKSKHGIFCVRGNHDFENNRGDLIKDHLAGNNIILLDKKYHHIEEINLTLTGYESPWTVSEIRLGTDNGLIIGLSHSPDNIIAFSKKGAHLVLSGHTHGGKINLPFIGPLLVPSKYGRLFRKGWYKYRETLEYVTAGLGYFPGRFGLSGEICHLVIRSSRNS